MRGSSHGSKCHFSRKVSTLHRPRPSPNPTHSQAILTPPPPPPTSLQCIPPPPQPSPRAATVSPPLPLHCPYSAKVLKCDPGQIIHWALSTVYAQHKHCSMYQVKVGKSNPSASVRICLTQIRHTSGVPNSDKQRTDLWKVQCVLCSITLPRRVLIYTVYTNDGLQHIRSQTNNFGLAVDRGLEN